MKKSKVDFYKNLQRRRIVKNKDLKVTAGFALQFILLLINRKVTESICDFQIQFHWK